MNSKENKIGKFWWNYVKASLLQLIPLFLYVLITIALSIVSGLDVELDETMTENCSIRFLAGILCYLGLLGFAKVVEFVIVCILDWKSRLDDIKNWLGWIETPYGLVNFKYPEISVDLAKSRFTKAKNVHLYCCIAQCALVLAVFLPELSSNFFEAFPAVLFMLAYYIVLNSMLANLNHKKTCPDCFHTRTTTEYIDGHSSTQKFTEYRDEKIGTLKIGEDSIHIYQEKANPYETTTTVQHHIVRCAICGHIMKEFTTKHTHTMSMATKNKIYQDIYNRIKKL